MITDVGTWLLFHGDGKAEKDQLAALTVSAHRIKVVPVSQYIELRDEHDVCFATITWPSTTNIRKLEV